MNNTQQLATPAAPNSQPSASPAETIFDRYADSVVGCYSHLYDGVEVHGVRDFATGTDDGTSYEIDNVTPTSFSVYVHIADGGLDCVGDFGCYKDAAQYGAEVGSQYGWPVRDYVPDQHRTTLAPLQ